MDENMQRAKGDYDPLWKLQGVDNLKDEVVKLRVELFGLKQTHQSPDQLKASEAEIASLRSCIDQHK